MPHPCNNCPFRVDAPREHWDPQHFLDIWKSCHDDGMALMLCHKSKPDEKIEIPCAGYIVVVGFDSIGLRIATSRGRIDPSTYSDGGFELFPTFAAMLLANGIKPPARNRWTDRLGSRR